MACIVELRGTADAHLREIVADGLPRLVRALAQQDRELPRFVTREFESYLGCRGPENGWACPHCNKPMTLRSIVIREPATMQVVSGLLRSAGPPVAA